MTGKQMCEAIVAFIKQHDPAAQVTAEEIWNISPSGEIWPVVALYDECVKRGMPPVVVA